MRGPKRRDIGHGALAERALLPMIPAEDEFPYTLRHRVRDARVQRLVLHGAPSAARPSRSWTPACRSRAPVAGIAMGLIKEGDDYIVLTDIQGDEDHLGDMDFKVAGTAEGITALQMDIKITGVTFEILRDALAQAKEGRAAHPRQAWPRRSTRPRDELSAWAPRITTIKIDPDQIGAVIGKGGETIRGLEADYERRDRRSRTTGTVKVYGVDGEKADEARRARIQAMTKDVEVGRHLPGAKVVKTTDLRRVRRADEGHGRPAAHLEPRPPAGWRRCRGRRQPRRHG